QRATEEPNAKCPAVREISLLVHAGSAAGQSVSRDSRGVLRNAGVYPDGDIETEDHRVEQAPNHSWGSALLSGSPDIGHAHGLDAHCRRAPEERLLLCADNL